ARSQLVKYLANNLETDQTLAMLLITSKGIKVVSGLTSDPTVLIKVAKNLGGQLSGMESVPIDVRATAASGDSSALLTSASQAAAQGALSEFVSNGDILYAQFMQENAIEATMRAFLDIAWCLSGV